MAPESLEWGFRPEIGLSDLPGANAAVGDLHTFANISTATRSGVTIARSPL